MSVSNPPADTMGALDRLLEQFADDIAYYLKPHSGETVRGSVIIRATQAITALITEEKEKRDNLWCTRIERRAKDFTDKYPVKTFHSHHWLRRRHLGEYLLEHDRALLKELKSKLPKEKDAFGEQMYPDKHREENLRKYGHNNCLTQVKQLIDDKIGEL